MVVHTYGHPVDMDPVMQLTRQRRLVVIEDAAEVHGARYLSGREDGAPEWKMCGGSGTSQLLVFSPISRLPPGRRNGGHERRYDRHPLPQSFRSVALRILVSRLRFAIDIPPSMDDGLGDHQS